MSCPLCTDPASLKYDEDKFRTYHMCRRCSLIYVPRDKILPFNEEAERYECHNNDEDNADYVTYLTKTAEAVKTVVGKNHLGLDFGCGKTTMMAKILASLGISTDSYDLYFHPREEIWSKKYDFILLCEVLEHLSDPAGVMTKLSALLNPGGRIFVKTKLYPPDPGAFTKWFYKRDLTHVQFFDYNSLSNLGQMMGMQGPFIAPATDLYEFRCQK